MRLPALFQLASTLLFSAMVSAIYPEVGCTTLVNTSEIMPAGSSLGDYCVTHGPMSRETKVSWTLGRTRVYACNYSKSGSNPCPIDEIEAAWNDIQERCGFGMGGWWYQEDWKKTYGFDDIDADWCGNM